VRGHVRKPRAYRKRVGISEPEVLSTEKKSMLTLDHNPIEPGASIRMDARLDATTRVTVDDLATQFHEPRAAVVCHIMRWGLSHGRAESETVGHPKALFGTCTATSTLNSMHEWSRWRALRESRSPHGCARW
jgi:hypothetical protein